MTVDVAWLITAVSVTFGVYQGWTNLRRNKSSDDKSEATQMTTVIVKLESIGTGIARIESEINNIKADVKDDRERIVKVEESAKSAHKRLDTYEKRLDAYENHKRFTDSDEK